MEDQFKLICIFAIFCILCTCILIKKEYFTPMPRDEDLQDINLLKDLDNVNKQHFNDDFEDRLNEKFNKKNVKLNHLFELHQDNIPEKDIQWTDTYNNNDLTQFCEECPIDIMKNKCYKGDDYFYNTNNKIKSGLTPVIDTRRTVPSNYDIYQEYVDPSNFRGTASYSQGEQLNFYPVGENYYSGRFSIRL